jgi:hypothetical protein
LELLTEFATLYSHLPVVLIFTLNLKETYKIKIITMLKGAVTVNVKGKGKTLPLQASAGLEGGWRYSSTLS